MASCKKYQPFPYEIRDLDPKLNEELAADFSNGTDFVHIGPEKLLLLSKFRRYADKCYNFEVRPDDVFVMGFSRSGTQLTQELAWLIINDADFEKAQKFHPHIRIPYLEAPCVIADKALEKEEKEGGEALKIFTSALEVLPEIKERRVIKTHLYFKFLPQNLLSSGCKVLYILRNPKDVIVSFYHLLCNGPEMKFVGGFEKFFNYFLKDLIYYNPYWQHIKQVWEKRNLPNVHILYYEDLTQNLRKNIIEVAKFLGKELTDQQVDLLEENLKIHNFRKYMSSVEKALKDRKDENDGYIRKGKIGDWKNYFSEEMNARANQWIEDNMKRIGVEYPFDIFK